MIAISLPLVQKCLLAPTDEYDCTYQRLDGLPKYAMAYLDSIVSIYREISLCCKEGQFSFAVIDIVQDG
ncbi:hypothetical protein J31TS3_26480 [Paenibacillus lactis]|nr:hypothetical protein J31TS3_26480 [Paenibacillus lactis]